MTTSMRSPSGSALVTLAIPLRPLVVSANQEGVPASVNIQGQCIHIRAVVNRWVIENMWKQGQSSRRIYYECQMTKTLRITLIRDLDSGSWYW